MRLLILNRDLPVFPGRAGHEHLNTTRLARQGHTVGLVSLLHGREQEERLPALSDAGVRLYLWRSPEVHSPVPPTPAAPRRLRRIVAAAYHGISNWRRHPADTLVQDRHFRLIAGPLVDALSEAPWQALVVVQSDCAHWIDYVPRPPASILVLHDVRALVYERRAAVAASLPERLAYRGEARRYRRFERRYCARFDLVVTVSSADEAWVRAHYRPRRLVTVPIPVDRSYFAPIPGVREVPGRIVFTGLMAHPPNADAAQFFARDVFPRVRSRVPEAEFWVVGGEVIPPVARLAERPGVVVTGFVPDVRPLLAEATVVVVPLRFGSGMRNKILEAWAMEKCVVSTRIGAEGLEGRDRVNLLLADGAEALADRVVEALEDPGLRDRVRARGRALVAASHDPDALAARYAEAIARALAETTSGDRPRRTVVDLRWMRRGASGRAERLARTLLPHLIQADPARRYRVLVPARARRGLGGPGASNLEVMTVDGPRRLARGAALGALHLPHRGLRLPYWRTPAVETLGRAAALDADVTLSIADHVHPDLAPLTNVVLVPALPPEYGPGAHAAPDADGRRRRLDRTVQRAAHVRTVSEFVRQTLIERLRLAPERVTTTPIGVDPHFEPGSPARARRARVLRRYSLPAGQYVLLPGSLWPHRNHEVAVAAWRVLRDAHGLTPLLVCAGRAPAGEAAALRARIRAAGLEDGVRLLGPCPPADMPALYEGAAALVFPSGFESFPVALLEAMWCDCPIVCANGTSLPEVAGDAALLVDPGSPEALADALSRVLTDEAQRRTLIARGRRRARMYDWGDCAQAILGALDGARRWRTA